MGAGIFLASAPSTRRDAVAADQADEEGPWDEWNVEDSLRLADGE
jgi:hypothetical protein